MHCCTKCEIMVSDDYAVKMNKTCRNCWGDLKDIDHKVLEEHARLIEEEKMKSMVEFCKKTKIQIVFKNPFYKEEK